MAMSHQRSPRLKPLLLIARLSAIIGVEKRKDGDAPHPVAAKWPRLDALRLSPRLVVRDQEKVALLSLGDPWDWNTPVSPRGGTLRVDSTARRQGPLQAQLNHGLDADNTAIMFA